MKEQIESLFARLTVSPTSGEYYNEIEPLLKNFFSKGIAPIKKEGSFLIREHRFGEYAISECSAFPYCIVTYVIEHVGSDSITSFSKTSDITGCIFSGIMYSKSGIGSDSYTKLTTFPEFNRFKKSSLNSA